MPLMTRDQVIDKYFPKLRNKQRKGFEIMYLEAFRMYGVVGINGIQLQNGEKIYIDQMRDCQEKGLKGPAAAAYIAANRVFKKENVRLL